MPDPYTQPDDQSSLGGAAPTTVIMPQMQVGDPDRATKFLAAHAARAQGAEDQFSQIMQQRQDAVAQTRAALDKTIAELQARHTGAGPGQVNLPLLALGAGLLGSGRPGVVSNFGSELGAGLKGMGAAIQSQRLSDTDYLSKVAELQAKSGQIADLPMRDAASFAKAKQLKEEGDQGAIEKALITSKADRPQSLGGGMLFDPKTNKVINGYTQQEINLDPTKVGAVGGQSLIGTDTHGDEFLKTVSDPILKQTIKDYANYDVPAPSMSRSPQAAAYQNYLLSMVKQYDPTFNVGNYALAQQTKKSFLPGGNMGQSMQAAGKVILHLANAQSAAADLDNAWSPQYNNVKNLIQKNSGDPRVARFAAAVQPVMTEMAKFMGGSGHPAEGQIEEWQNKLANASSPKQLQATFNEFIDVMYAQLRVAAAAKNTALNGKQTPDELVGGNPESGLTPDDFRNLRQSILKNDISTTGGRLAVLRRGENDKRSLAGQPALPTPEAEQWEAAGADLKKQPTPERRAQFDQAFGPGSAARVLGR